MGKILIYVDFKCLIIIRVTANKRIYEWVEPWSYQKVKRYWQPKYLKLKIITWNNNKNSSLENHVIYFIIWYHRFKYYYHCPSPWTIKFSVHVLFLLTCLYSAKCKVFTLCKVVVYCTCVVSLQSMNVAFPECFVLQCYLKCFRCLCSCLSSSLCEHSNQARILPFLRLKCIFLPA